VAVQTQFRNGVVGLFLAKPEVTSSVPIPVQNRTPISFIMASTFARYVQKLPSSSTGVIFIRSTVESPEPAPVSLPPEYSEFADLFDKKSAEQLPEHQPWDHTIPLVDGK
jgi:hypothetical protein